MVLPRRSVEATLWPALPPAPAVDGSVGFADPSEGSPEGLPVGSPEGSTVEEGSGSDTELVDDVGAMLVPLPNGREPFPIDTVSVGVPIATGSDVGVTGYTTVNCAPPSEEPPEALEIEKKLEPSAPVALGSGSPTTVISAPPPRAVVSPPDP